MDRWREQGGLRYAFGTWVTWPRASPDAALLLPGWDTQKPRQPWSLGAEYLPALVFPKQSMNSRFLGPTHSESECRTWEVRIFESSPVTTHASGENWCLIALQMLFPLPRCPSSLFLYLLDLQPLLPRLLCDASFQAPSVCPQVPGTTSFSAAFILCPDGCLRFHLPR